MANTLYTCGHCNEDIDEVAEEMYADDSGEYHQDCQDDYSDREQAYWGARYYAEQSPKPATDHLGYDWGDSKNSAYVEWAIDNADAGRG